MLPKLTVSTTQMVMIQTWEIADCSHITLEQWNMGDFNSPASCRVFLRRLGPDLDDEDLLMKRAIQEKARWIKPIELHKGNCLASEFLELCYTSSSLTRGPHRPCASSRWKSSAVSSTGSTNTGQERHSRGPSHGCSLSLKGWGKTTEFWYEHLAKCVGTWC